MQTMNFDIEPTDAITIDLLTTPFLSSRFDERATTKGATLSKRLFSQKVKRSIAFKEDMHCEGPDVLLPSTYAQLNLAAFTS